MAPASGNTFAFTLPVGQGTWSTQTHNIVANASTAPSATVPLVVSIAPVCGLSNLTITIANPPANVRTNGQHTIEDDVTIRVTRSSLTVCAAPTVTVTPGLSGPPGSATDLTTPKTMRNVGATNGSCDAITCEWVIRSGQRDWHPGPVNRTVTVAASGATATGTLTLTYG